MSAFSYLVLGYALIWAALGFYLYFLGRRVRRVREEVEELRRRVEVGGPEPR